jgi:hypothetical protein
MEPKERSTALEKLIKNPESLGSSDSAANSSNVQNEQDFDADSNNKHKDNDSNPIHQQSTKKTKITKNSANTPTTQKQLAQFFSPRRDNETENVNEPPDKQG